MISVIIPSRFSLPLLREQLEALVWQRCDEDFEVVVADNTQGERDHLELEAICREFADRLPALRLIDARSGSGAAFARNAGVAASRGDKLAFLDADDVAAPGWLAAMAAALTEHDFVASRWDNERLNAPEVRASRKNTQATGPAKYRTPEYLDHCGGCGMGVSRAAFEAVGGFDADFRLLEDTDLSWRLQLAGYPLRFASDAVVHIRYRPTTTASFRQSFGFGMYNSLLHKRFRKHGMPVVKHMSLPTVVYTLMRYLTQLRDATRRPRVVWAMGHLLGRVFGSVAFGVWGF